MKIPQQKLAGRQPLLPLADGDEFPFSANTRVTVYTHVYRWVVGKYVYNLSQYEGDDVNMRQNYGRRSDFLHAPQLNAYSR